MTPEEMEEVLDEYARFLRDELTEKILKRHDLFGPSPRKARKAKPRPKQPCALCGRP